MTDANDRTTTYTYTDNCQLETVNGPGNAGLLYNYDSSANSVVVYFSNGTTYYTYDSVGRLSTSSDAAGGSTSYTYDLLDRVTAVTDRNGRVRTFQYDPLGRLTAENWLDGSGTVVR